MDFKPLAAMKMTKVHALFLTYKKLMHQTTEKKILYTAHAANNYL